MEFDEHEEQEGEIGINNLGGRKSAVGGGGGGGTTGAAAGTTPVASTTTYRYRECLKNHAVEIGGNAVDGCGEFMAAGPDGTLESFKCAACSCHRSFHRKETEGGGGGVGGGEGFHHHHHHPPLHHPHPHLTTAYSFRSPHPSGYLHVTPPTRPLALPATSEDMSNPSSSGGGASGGGGSKKRFRTRFTAEQKDKMLALAERLGWRIQKQDEALVQQFCAETNVRRHVLKVWMHNNKHTLGKKP